MNEHEQNMPPPDLGKHPEGFNGTEPTAQMIGIFQPWTDEHTKLFERILETEVDQVCIAIRHMPQPEYELQPPEVGKYIEDALGAKGYTQFKDFVIMIVPNITRILQQKEDNEKNL